MSTLFALEFDGVSIRFVIMYLPQIGHFALSSTCTALFSVASSLVVSFPRILPIPSSDCNCYCYCYCYCCCCCYYSRNCWNYLGYHPRIKTKRMERREEMMSRREIKEIWEMEGKLGQ